MVSITISGLTKGVIQVVDKLLRIPDNIGIKTIHVTNLETILGELSDVSTFHSLLEDVNFPSTYSIFVPANIAFQKLHPVELSYLKTLFGLHDRNNLLHRHATKEILYSKHLKKGGNTTSLEGETLHFKQSDDDILIDFANVTESDIVARNGIPQDIMLT